MRLSKMTPFMWPSEIDVRVPIDGSTGEDAETVDDFVEVS